MNTESANGEGVDNVSPHSEGLIKRPDHLYDGYIFDLDGTIYLGGELLPGARRLVLKLRELGKRVVFLSNNPTRDVNQYA